MMVFMDTDMNRRNICDRVTNLLATYKWSDCCFSVCGKEFKAHKLILGISSPVFEAMFYGPLSTNDCIVVPDIEPDVFQQLLNYIYTDKVEFRSLDEALELLYAAKKYLMDELSVMCINYVKNHLNIDNVMSTLNCANYLQDESVMTAALALFRQHAEYLLQEHKKDMSPQILKQLLESNELNIKEKDLIKYVFASTTLYCEQNKLAATREARRNVLIKCDIFKSLRFLTISLDDLEEIVVDENNLLVPSEVDRLRDAIKGTKVFEEKDETETLGRIYSERFVLELKWKICFRKPLKSVAPISIDANNPTILTWIRSKESIFVTSFCVPTRMVPSLVHNITKAYPEKISVSVISETDNKVIKFVNYMNMVEYDSMVFIDLSEPFVMKRDKWYKIKFAFDHSRYHSHSYAVQCRDNRYFKDCRLLLEFEDMNCGNCGLGSFLAGLKYSL